MLVGYAGSGKDYIAARMQGYTRVAFADILKDTVALKYNIPLEYFHERELKDTYYSAIGMTPRCLLINYATKQRLTDTNCFAKLVIDKIENSTYNGSWVITDCRFYNEIYTFKRAFGADNVSIVWIDRKGVVKGNDSIEIMKEDCDEVLINV